MQRLLSFPLLCDSMLAFPILTCIDEIRKNYKKIVRKKVIGGIIKKKKKPKSNPGLSI